MNNKIFQSRKLSITKKRNIQDNMPYNYSTMYHNYFEKILALRIFNVKKAEVVSYDDFTEDTIFLDVQKIKKIKSATLTQEQGVFLLKVETQYSDYPVWQVEVEPEVIK